MPKLVSDSFQGFLAFGNDLRANSVARQQYDLGVHLRMTFLISTECSLSGEMKL
jgi:hypothetical protein